MNKILLTILLCLIPLSVAAERQDTPCKESEREFIRQEMLKDVAVKEGWFEEDHTKGISINWKLVDGEIVRTVKDNR